LAKQEKEIKPNPEKKTPDKEAEEIKEQTEKVTEEQILGKIEEKKEKPKEEIPEEKPKEGFNISKFLKGFYEKNDIWVWLIGLGFLIWAGIKLLSKSSQSTPKFSPKTESPSTPQSEEYEEVDISYPGKPPRIIRIPKRKY
jgi:hypothetical protein